MAYKFSATILLSFVLHAAILMLAPFPKSESVSEKEPDNGPVRITINSGTKPAPVAEPKKTIAKSKASSSASKGKRQVEKASSSASDTARQLSYVDLLPTGNFDFKFPRGETEGRTDGDEEDISLEQEAGNASEMILLAKELRERIGIPHLVRSRFSAASVLARLDEKNHGWRIKRLTGEPIFRAILFEALGGAKLDSYLTTLLSRTDYNWVRIDFTFRDAPPFNGTEHWKYNSIKNVIYLQYHDFADANIDPVSKGFDVLAAIALAARMAQSQSEVFRSDPEIRRLMSSPAYARPIW